MNAQITTIMKFNEAEYDRAMEYVDKVGGLDAWKKGLAGELDELIKTELPADDVVVSDIKWFEMEVSDV